MWNIQSEGTGRTVRPARKNGGRGSRSLSRGARLCLICFFAGLIIGTAAGNWIYGKHGLAWTAAGDGSRGAGQIDWAAGPGSWPMSRSIWRQEPGNGEKLIYLLQRRLGEGAVGWILGLTVCAVPAFGLLALYGGFSMGWVITCCTLQNGILGLPVFLLSCFPQFLFYVPVWCLLVWWGLTEPRRVRVLPALAAAGMLGLGAAAEAFWNPFFLNML